MDAQEARLYLTIIITGLVLGTIIIYFTFSVIRQQRRNLELQKANALAEISAMEKERARIAADLHDDLGPVLSVIKFRIDHAVGNHSEQHQELVKASGQLDELITRIREVANNLMPSALHRRGLIGAIEEFIRNVAATSKMAIGFRADHALIIGEEKSINIYRVVQEMIHNGVKHSKATHMELDFTIENTLLKIICRDNGSGFDHIRLLRESKGIGLQSIQNRTAIMNGRLEVISKEGKGTVFLVEIPIV